MLLTLIKKAPKIECDSELIANVLGKPKKEQISYNQAKKLVKKYEQYFWGYPTLPNVLGCTKSWLGDRSRIEIQMREKKEFIRESQYYITAFHEISHAISWQKGLALKHSYAEEELCAEYTAYRIGKKLKLNPSLSSIYLRYWYERPDFVFGFYTKTGINIDKVEYHSDKILEEITS